MNIIKIDMDIAEMLYPEYEKTKKLTITNKGMDLLYYGDQIHISKLEKHANKYISIVPLDGSDILDLTKPLDLFEFIKCAKASEREKVIITSIDKNSIKGLIKTYILTGSLGDDSCKYTMFDLFKSTIGSKQECFSILFTLLNHYPDSVVEKSLNTFFKKVLHEHTKLSNAYKALIEKARAIYGKRLQTIILNSRRIQNIESRLIYIISNL